MGTRVHKVNEAGLYCNSSDDHQRTRAHLRAWDQRWGTDHHGSHEKPEQCKSTRGRGGGRTAWGIPADVQQSCPLVGKTQSRRTNNDQTQSTRYCHGSTGLNCDSFFCCCSFLEWIGAWKIECVMFGEFFKNKQQHPVVSFMIAASTTYSPLETSSADLASELRWPVISNLVQPLLH